MTLAITPAEVKNQIGNRTFPDFVIESFNEEILEAAMRGSDKVIQDAVIRRIMEKTDYTRRDIFAQHWLDVEAHYAKAGWVVTYVKPAYNETFDAYFVFS